MADVWLIAIFLIPIVLITFLRVNAVYVYLGLCMGYVLSLYDNGNSVVTKLAGTRAIEKLGGSNDIRLILLILPAILILFFMMNSAHGGKYSINILPAIAVGILAVITVIPLLPVSASVSIMNSTLWTDVIKYQGALIAASAVVVLLLLIIQKSKLGKLSKGSKHHKSKE